MPYNLTDVAIVAGPDKVAVALENLRKGSVLYYDDKSIKLQQRVPMGHRFALTKIPRQEYITHYGHPYGKARKVINPGQIIWNRRAEDYLEYGYDINLCDIHPGFNIKIPRSHMVAAPHHFARDSIRTFKGYVRGSVPKRGKVGTRNYIAVIPVSFCSENMASKMVHIAKEIASSFKGSKTKGLDGIVALENNSGCGCSEKRRDLVAEILANYARHPNIGGVLFVENGCELTCFSTYRRKYRGACYEKPVKFLSFQKDFGCNFKNTIDAGVRWIRENIKNVAAKRQDVPISYLNLALQCGGSDSFSGFTGNVAVGELSDLLVRNYGTVILSEVPEAYGAHHILVPRGKNAKVAKEILEFVKWYYEFGKSMNQPVDNNPSFGNVESGLINIVIKSLGAIIKGGTTRIEGTAQYGEIIKKRGLWFMQSTGGDPASVTGEVASGANILAMTTGCGTILGNPIVPVIKIVNTNKYPNSDIFDYYAYPILTGEKTKERAGKELLELMIKVVSGEKTKCEINNCSKLLIWFANTIAV